MDDSETNANTEPISVRHDDRLDSWKRIATYLKRDVSTVQRWERREGMPVHRHVHDKLGSVFAFRSELDAWWQSRSARVEADSHASEAAAGVAAEPPSLDEAQPPTAATAAPPAHARRLPLAAALIAFAAVAGGGAWLVASSEFFWRNPLTDAKFTPAAEFADVAHTAEISRDGRYVALIAQRDGQTDAWVAEFGGPDYRNVTRGQVRDLVNPAVRTLGFSADSSFVSVWTRAADGSHPEDVRVLAAPAAGGALQPFMSNVAELDWSPDGQRFVYHTTAPGDPMFVRDSPAGPEAAGDPIVVAPAGVHNHFPTWSPDGKYIYFVRGVPGEHWDIWRTRPSGVELERITRHESDVSHPVMLDPRTLLYLATDADGSGPWIYAMDVERRNPHRVSSGLETYTSLGASRSGERLVATVARRRASLWRLRLETGAPSAPEPLASEGGNPRIGRGFVLYTAARGDRQGVWILEHGASRELWNGARSRIVGAPALAPDGRRIAFTADVGGETLLHVMDADGSSGRVLAESPTLRGSPVWWPDGESVLAAAVRDGEPHLTRIFLNGDPPRVLVSEYSVDPVWAPGGRFFVYSGADVGTTFPLRAAAADGRPYPIPGLQLTRGARRVAFVNDRPTLIFLSGELAHKDLWAMDLQTGNQRLLAELPNDFVVDDFDVSPDGTEAILGRIEETSTLALIERAQ